MLHKNDTDNKKCALLVPCAALLVVVVTVFAPSYAYCKNAPSVIIAQGNIGNGTVNKAVNNATNNSIDGSTQNDATPEPDTPSDLPPPKDFFEPAKPARPSKRAREVPAEKASTPNTESNSDNSLPVRGIKSWYGQLGIGAGVEESSRCDPASEACSSPIAEARYYLLTTALMGWGPLRTDHVLFNLHYRYTQNWGTDYVQFQRFVDKWFSTRKAADFVFPTKTLLRTHETGSDLRFIANPFQAGLFSRITFSRIGSATFGESLEEAETLVVSENFVPYVSYKYEKYYRGQLSFPFRTEINRQDPRLSNASYSFSSKGRGRVFSLKLSNGVHIPRIDSLFYIDLLHTELKYASIVNDRKRNSVSANFDFPVVWALRISPRASYAKDEFIVEAVRIPDYSNSKAKALLKERAQLTKRNDTFLSFGLYSYWDFDKSSKVYVSLSRDNTTSNLPEFSQMRSSLVMGYSYSWPSTNTVGKRVDRFSESPYAEEF